MSISTQRTDRWSTSRRSRSRSRTAGVGFRRAWIEYLEDRILMAIRVWDGGGADSNWSTAANWLGDLAPQQDDNLVFPTSGTRHTNVNDFTNMRFRSITISGNDYGVSGNGLTLLEGFVYNATASGANFSAAITLGAAQSFYSANSGAEITLGSVNIANLQPLTVDGRGNININGAISGTGSLSKSGDGILSLSGNNLSYDGTITVTQGIVRAKSSNALGAATAGTIVGQGAQLQVDGDGMTIPEPIVLNHFGPGFDASTMGALYNLSGTNTWSGFVSLGTTAANSVASVGAAASTTLKITGSVSSIPGATANAGDNQLFKFGAGTVELGGTTENYTNATVTVLQGTLALNKKSGAHPFFGSLVIGDNRDGNTAKVQLLDNDQIPETNFFATGINLVTVNSNGTLDLGQFNDTIGNLTMVTGRSTGGIAQSTTGTLTVLGNITVNNFQGSSGAADTTDADTSLTSAALIKGKLNLGSFFSGLGGVIEHQIQVNDTALPNPAADLVITADISGGAQGQVTKTGTGTLRLAGANSDYQGPTRVTAGIVEIGSNKAFGQSSLVALGSGTNIVYLKAYGAARTIDRPISLDSTTTGNLTILGDQNLTFSSTTQTLLTGSGGITVLDPNQVTTFQSGITEGIFAGANNGITKSGKGELRISGPSNFTGTLIIGGSATVDGGIIRFADNGTLLNNVSAITVRNGQLILDNSGTAKSDRITDQAAITLTQGRITLIGNAANDVSETVGPLTVSANTTGTLESQAPSASPSTTTSLNIWGINAVAATSSVNFVGTNVALSESGIAD